MVKPIVQVFLLVVATVAHGAQLPAEAARTLPVPIYDGGGVPVGQYLKYIVPDERSNSLAGRPVVQPPASRYPVVTLKAKPGLLGQPIRSKLPGGPNVPICVVGDDQLSRHWLALNLATLEKMGARCLVVSARDESAYRRVRESAGNLLLTPGSFDALASATGIAVWPVLISPDGLVSQ